MPRPVLPRGRRAPWILAAVAAVLLLSGLVTRDREMLVIGLVAAALWLLAFPAAHALIGRDSRDDSADE